jgi:hypothetical protein
LEVPVTLQLCVSRCALAALDHNESAEPSYDDDEWAEPDSAQFDDDAFLDFCEIDDAPQPSRGDYWDDSLDGEWTLPSAEFGARSSEFRQKS